MVLGFLRDFFKGSVWAQRSISACPGRLWGSSESLQVSQSPAWGCGRSGSLGTGAGVSPVGHPGVRAVARVAGDAEGGGGREGRSPALVPHRHSSRSVSQPAVPLRGGDPASAWASSGWASLGWASSGLWCRLSVALGTDPAPQSKLPPRTCWPQSPAGLAWGCLPAPPPCGAPGSSPRCLRTVVWWRNTKGS